MQQNSYQVPFDFVEKHFLLKVERLFTNAFLSSRNKFHLDKKIWGFLAAFSSYLL